jgi:hypothetical protein
MDARKLYDEHMNEFKHIHESIVKAVPFITVLPDDVGLSDCYDMRILREKSLEVLKFIDNLISSRYPTVKRSDNQRSH